MINVVNNLKNKFYMMFYELKFMMKSNGFLRIFFVYICIICEEKVIEM